VGVIVVVGEALIDLVIDPDGTVHAKLGGAPFNTARACGRLGAPVAFVGAISIDRFGTMLAGQLQADRVSTDWLPRVTMPTTLAAAELDDRGTASYRFYIDGTSAPALVEAPGVAPTVLFTGGLGLVLHPMADTVERMVAEASADCLVMVDVNCRPLVIPDRESYLRSVDRVIAGADLVKVSDEDLAYIAPGVDPIAAARALLALGPSAVLVTAGGGAVHVLTADGQATVPVDRVEVVDTIGAGDSFGAGFLCWWLESGNTVSDLGSLDHLVPAIRAATVVAGIVCGRRGADPPWRLELPPTWSP
jgi:fructokinase